MGDFDRLDYSGLSWTTCEECGVTGILVYDGSSSGSFCSRCREKILRGFCTGYSFLPLYRSIRPDESCERGLFPSNPSADLSLEEHILGYGDRYRGGDGSQFISCSTRLDTAIFYAIKGALRDLTRVDTDQLSVRVVQIDWWYDFPTEQDDQLLFVSDYCEEFEDGLARYYGRLFDEVCIVTEQEQAQNNMPTIRRSQIVKLITLREKEIREFQVAVKQSFRTFRRQFCGSQLETRFLNCDPICIALVRTKIVGCRHYQGISELVETSNATLTRIQLVPEPTNEFDKNAIIVCIPPPLPADNAKKGTIIGYICREHASCISQEQSIRYFENLLEPVRKLNVRDYEIPICLKLRMRRSRALEFGHDIRDAAGGCDLFVEN